VRKNETSTNDVGSGLAFNIEEVEIDEIDQQLLRLNESNIESVSLYFLFFIVPIISTPQICYHS